MDATQAQPHAVVVVGGGVAGIEIASMLGRRCRSESREVDSGVTVTLVDSDSAHVWKPMLHTIAAGTADVSQQETSFLAQAHAAGFTFMPGELSGLDRTAQSLRLAALRMPDGREAVPARTLHYDTLVIAVGSEANDFGTRGVAEHCRRIDSRRQAIAFNDEVRLRLLQCATKGEMLSIGIVGGGATGVELAAELVQLVAATSSYGLRGLTGKIVVTPLGGRTTTAAGFPRRYFGGH